MTDVQRADSTAWRKAIIIVIISAIVGSLLIVVFESYRLQMFDWLLSDHGKLAHRLRILIILAAAFEAIPLFSCSVYLWPLGCKILNYKRFSLPGQRVIRDTLILEGQAAMKRGRVLKTLAVFLAVAGVILCFVFWRLIAILEELMAYAVLHINNE
jgi:hypothetical protein